VWERLHALLLAELRAVGEQDWSRTFAWLHHFKRLLVRYDRRHEITRPSERHRRQRQQAKRPGHGCFALRANGRGAE